jgi:hypothetical protein
MGIVAVNAGSMAVLVEQYALIRIV